MALLKYQVKRLTRYSGREWNLGGFLSHRGIKNRVDTKSQPVQSQLQPASPWPWSLSIKGKTHFHLSFTRMDWIERKSVSQTSILDSPQVTDYMRILQQLGWTDRGCHLDIRTQPRYPQCIPHQASQADGTGQAWGEMKLGGMGVGWGPWRPWWGAWTRQF